MTVRLFFALPLDTASKAEIQHWRAHYQQSYQAAWVPAGNFHVTLAFVGDTPRDSIDGLIDYTDSKIDHGLFPFVWDVNHVSHFRSGVLYLTGYNTPFEMMHLVKALDFFVPLHTKPPNFIPHITLAKQANPIEMTPPELSLTFSRLVLYESITTDKGVVYQELKSWSSS